MAILASRRYGRWWVKRRYLADGLSAREYGWSGTSVTDARLPGEQWLMFSYQALLLLIGRGQAMYLIGRARRVLPTRFLPMR